MQTPTPRFLTSFDTFRLPQHMTDVLVVGTGVAGCSAALAAAAAGRRVLVLAKGDPALCNTARAQGGIAAALPGGADDPGQHAEDTLRVGCGLCDEDLVREVTGAAAAGIDAITAQGAQFDAAPDGTPARGLEGGHSRPRILHARGDATGAEIRDVLARAVDAHPKIDVWSNAFLVDILTDEGGAACGALLHSRKHLRVMWADAVVLASGGFSQVYRESSNVPDATGDGVLAAHRAGASLRDMEFVQFHPTTLYLAGVPRLLITEAVRGEGAHIVDNHDKRFVAEQHKDAELAPRDVISQLIMAHLQRPDVSGVFLDLRHLDAAHLAKRFPGVSRSCAAHGLDWKHDRIPIRPAAHYTVGGVAVDHEGATGVPGLYAAGEVTSSGRHGANRLASNSLLEGLILGRRTGTVAAAVKRTAAARPPRLRGQGPGNGQGTIDADDLRLSLKALMWREAGILRSGGHLEGALEAVRAWEGFAHRVGQATPERFALLNMLGIARRVVASALRREESRGTHARRDFPARDDHAWRAHLVHTPDGEINVVKHIS